MKRIVAAGGTVDSLRAFRLRRNGEDVALVIERALAGDRRIALVGAPPQALTRAPQLYGAILGDATSAP